MTEISFTVSEAVLQSYSEVSQYSLHLLLWDYWDCLLYSLLEVVDFSRPSGVHFILNEFPQMVIMCRWIRWTWSLFSGIMHCGSIFRTTFSPAIIVWAPWPSCWSHGMLLLLQHEHCLRRNTSLWPKAILVKLQPFRKVFLAIGHLNDFIDAN